MTKNMKRRMLSIVMSAAVAMTSFQFSPVDKSYAATSYAGDFDSKYAYSGNDLGCNYSKESTTFKVWAPTASKVVLVRYKTGDGSDKIEEVAMTGGTQGDKGVWSCTVKGDIINTYYTYKITTPENGEAEACDIYANSVGVNGDRAMVVDMNGEDTVPSTANGDATDWDTNYKRTKTRLSDMVTWEVHVRDFSYDESSGVKDEYRGKYLAFTQKGTTLNNEGNIQTGIDYLKKLGITHVQILPMYDYGFVDENNADDDRSYNWGYDPKNFNAPEGSYSTDPKDGNVRVKELREMIQALHDAGIKVIMDVVYNHTYMNGSKEEAWFDETVPKYYYRTNNTSSNGTYTNGSGCGNETRSESAMYRKYMRDSIMHWAKDYNLDGFRFDLMGLHDVDTMNAIRADLDKEFGEGTMILYGEGWTGGTSGINGTPSMKENVRSLNNIGFFNDQIRDAAQGERKPDGTIGLAQQGYVAGSTLAEKWPDNVYGGIKGSVGKSSGQYWMWRAYWSDSSDKVVSYVSCHDNLALWDKLVATGKTTKQNVRGGDIEYATGNFNSTEDKYIRMNRLTGGYVLTSHGGSFMQAGEEFARSKNGNENSYASLSSENAIDWNRLKTYSAIQQYYQGMISIRRVFSGFRNTLTESGNNDKPNGSNFDWIETEGSVDSIAYYLSNDVQGEWDKVAVMINNTTADRTYNLKASDSWVLVSDGEKADVKGVKTVNSSSVTVPAKSVAVAVPKDTFDANPNVSDKLNKNSAPTISGAQDQSVAAGSKVEFTVTAKDADGDKVTLSAKDVPEGAEFDSATGKFTWDSAKDGEHKVTFTASDGKDTTTKTITITVTSATSDLKKLVEEVEAAGFTEAALTAEVWKNLQTALEQAKAVISKENPDDGERDLAVVSLNVAYTAAKNEKDARTDLENSVKDGKKKIDEADDSVDAELLKDAKSVLEETNTLLDGVATAKAYKFAKENLEDSTSVLVGVASTPQVHVSTSFGTPYIYIWTGSGTTATKIAGAWPGTKLENKDSEGNYVYDLPDDGKYNIIINNGSNHKTDDLENLSGNVTIKVAATASGTDGQDTIYSAETECKPVSISAPEVTKESLQNTLKEAKEYSAEYYKEESFKALQDEITKAETVVEDTDATQLAVNQQARALRKAILALEVKDDVDLPTDTPFVTGTPGEETTPPSETPDVSAEPTDTPEVPTTDTPVPSDGKPTETPEDSGAPEDTATPSPDGTNTPAPSDIPVSDQPASQTPEESNSPAPDNSNTPATATPTPAATAKLKISSLTFSPSLYQVVKNNIKLTVKAEGGKKAYSYKYNIYDSQGTLVASKAYGSKATYTWKPTKTGTYKFKVTVKDANGTEVVKSKSIIVVAKKLTALYLKANKNTIKKGKTLTFTAKATGGKKSYKYKFTVKNAKGKTVKSTSYGKKNVWKWKATKTGTYKIQVTIKDALGVKVTKTIKKVRVIK